MNRKHTGWRRGLALVALAVGVAACAASVGNGGSGSAADANATADGGLVADAGVGGSEDAAGDIGSSETVELDSAQADSAQQDSAQADTKPVAPQTNGEYLDPPLDAPPEFVKVKDTTGAYVAQDALYGHYTVLWFYPAASTAG